MSDPIVTKHAEKRSKQRIGGGKKTANKTAAKALQHGLTHSETKGGLNKYLNGLYLRHENANNMRVFNQKVFLFRNDVLITIINLPHNLAKRATALQKRKLGNES